MPDEKPQEPAPKKNPNADGAADGKEKAVARGGQPGAVAAAGAGGHAVVIAQPAPVGPTIPAVSRRKVMIIGFWTAMGAMLLGIGATILNSLWPRGITGFGAKITVGTVAAISPGQKIHNLEAKTWLVRLNEDQAANNPPATAGSIIALYHKCPHLGCTVPYRPEFSREDPRNGKTYAGWFLCPCHGSTYSDAGVRVFGPAPRSMDTFPIVIDDSGSITVDTGTIITGSQENPERAIEPNA